MRTPTRRSVLAALSGVSLAGCASSRNGGADGGATGRETTGETTGGPGAGGDAGGTDGPGTVALPAGASSYRYTHPQPTGNRALDGGGDARGADPVTLAVSGRPRWLVAYPLGRDSGWTVVTAEGGVTHWRVADGEAIRAGGGESGPGGGPGPGTGTPARPSPDRPPVVAVGPDGATVVRAPPDLAPMAAPAVVPDAGDGTPALAYLAANGDLVVAGASRARFPVAGLPDGRVTAVGDGRYALFGGATGRYTHGALGDTTEGSRLVIVDPATPAVVARTPAGPPEVFEGLGPMAADLEGDGAPAVVTTVADATAGARIAVFDADGTRRATGPIHGSGWRHQLAVAPFGPDGGQELAVVRKPHVEHVLEFYRLRGDSLTVVATVGGFSSHTYGSRIIDGAVAADLDGDGAVEALVPTTAREALAAVRRTAGGADVIWRLPLGGTLATNVTGVALPDGRVAVGAGTADGVRVWQG